MNPTIQVFPDIDSLSQAAAGHFTQAMQEAVNQRGQAYVALSGGNTPRRLFRLLAEAPFAEQIRWEMAHFFWCDERCVPPDDPESNFGQAQQALFQHILMPAQNLHPMPGEMSPEQAAQAYSETLYQFRSPGLRWPAFDLVLLGLGADGHTASLFPGAIHPFQDQAPRLAAPNLAAPVLAVTASYQGRPAQRVTLTPVVFNTARQVVFLVSGADKAVALAQTLFGPPDPDQLPAQRIRPVNGSLVWMVDRDAAGKLG